MHSAFSHSVSPLCCHRKRIISQIELSPSQTKEPNGTASVRGVSSKHYGTLKSTPIASRMYSKPYTTDTKPPPLTTNPRPPKSRLIDSAKKPSPEDPTTDRRDVAYQKYRGRHRRARQRLSESRPAQHGDQIRPHFPTRGRRPFPLRHQSQTAARRQISGIPGISKIHVFCPLAS